MSAAPGEPIIKLEQVSRIYDTGKVQVPALVDVNLEVAKGEFLAIIGPSGSGKSTMMNILGCLDRPTSGLYVLDGQPVDELSDDGRARLAQTLAAGVKATVGVTPRMELHSPYSLPRETAGQGKTACHRVDDRRSC